MGRGGLFFAGKKEEREEDAGGKSKELRSAFPPEHAPLIGLAGRLDAGDRSTLHVCCMGLTARELLYCVCVCTAEQEGGKSTGSKAKLTGALSPTPFLFLTCET